MFILGLTKARACSAGLKYDSVSQISVTLNDNISGSGIVQLAYQPLVRSFLSPNVCPYECKVIKINLEAYSLYPSTMHFAFHCILWFVFCHAVSSHVCVSALYSSLSTVGHGSCMLIISYFLSPQEQEWKKEKSGI